MPYIVIEDFKAGLDKRRLEQGAEAGSLITLANAHINRGGEIEKARAWVEKYVLPANTFGLQALNDELYVFGSQNPPVMPSGVLYQRLEHENGGTPAMTELLGSDILQNEIFAVAKFQDDSVRPFSDGTLVADFLVGSGVFAENLVVNGAVLTYKNKVYLASETNMLFSGSGVPDSFDGGGDGSGLIDVSTQVSNETNINGYSSYQNSLAVFSLRNITIWSVDPDPDAYALLQILPGIGTVAPRSVVAYGDHDVFFLSHTGLRSIRAINSSLAAGVTDVGTPIDDLLITVMTAMDPADIARAVGAIEPRDGRYLLSLGGIVYVFSYFYSSKISSWSTWEPEIEVTNFAVIDSRMYARAEDKIYLYGGDDNDIFTEEEVIVETPYLDARTIADWKFWTGLDLVLQGRWIVYVNTDPNAPDEWEETAVIAKHTLDLQRISIQQHSPVMKFKFVHQGEGPARLSKLIFHYKAAGKQ